MKHIAQVLIPRPLPEAFDYAEPEGMDLSIGQVVTVPLGAATTLGVVTSLRDAAGVNRALKPVDGKLDAPLVPPTTVEFVNWAAHYSVAAPGLPLAIALRGLRSPRPKVPRWLMAASPPAASKTPARERVLKAAAAPISAAALMQAAGVSRGLLGTLVADGHLVWVDAPSPGPISLRFEGAAVPNGLNASQAAAARSLTKLISRHGFSVTLLDGVTGSGKTEVYLEAAADLLISDPLAQVLIMLPEIALTQRVVDRVAARFGLEPAEWHSGLSPPRRRQVWEAVALGRSRVIVGARSALFLPYKALRLIVVDEEHDTSYKQEDGFIYQARDLSVARGRIEDCCVVLASATPSLETLWNAKSGRYRWLKLTDRFGVASMPAISVVDMRRSPPEAGHWLSPVLIAAMAETLGRREQVLLFLNRRGYAPLVMCRACGERLKAPDTDSWLVEHRYSGRLICHLTGFSMPKPAACPRCGAKGSLVSIGPGVERIEEEARLRFPDARLAVFSSDTVVDASAARRLIEAMAAGDFDILVATQGAAKGHNFPNLTLVGVIDADLGLRGGDPRAAERTFQLLAQVSGRAGRHDRPGRALIQTWAPDHPVMQAIAAGDREGFVEAELAERKIAGLPPFGRLAAIVVSGPDGGALRAFAASMAATAPNTEGVDVFGPADAPLSLVRGRRRLRFLVRADRSVDLQSYLAAWKARFKPPSTIRISIDVDPYSFL